MAGKLFNIIFQDAPHQGKNTVLVAEVDPDAHPGHPLPPERPPGSIWPDPGPLPGIEHPICLPGMQCWGPPIHISQPICLPTMPCWEPPDTQPPEEPVVLPATVSQVPAGSNPPDAPSENVRLAVLDLGPDAKAEGGVRKFWIWIEPPVPAHLPAK